MNVKFYLDKPRNTISMIFISATHNNNRVKKSTGFKVQSKYWSQKQQKVKNHDSKNLLPPIALNSFLTSLSAKIFTAFSELILDEPINNETLKKLISSILDNSSNTNSLVDIFDKYISEMELLQNKSKSTITKYKEVKKHLLKYESQNNVKLMPNDINYNFTINFYNYFSAIMVSNVSVGTYLKYVKSTMNWGLQNNLHSNNKYSKEISTASKSFNNKGNHKSALTESELSLIENIELSDELNTIRNMFLFQTYTCLRFSEMQNLTIQSVDDKLISVFSNKNNKMITRPITNKLKKLIENNKIEELLFSIKLDYYNMGIKEICKQAGIDQQVEVIRNYGKTNKITYLPKYELMSSHIARHTFVSILLIKGMSVSEVMKITDHSSYDVLKHYVDLEKTRVYEKVGDLM
ncbi:tyrosine-type recombinase/integrase [Candidatus Kapabacteria bacterium]|nr:tyrosine-type recombinase/integrase [Candidatus Kapabacteria bacterium]